MYMTDFTFLPPGNTSSIVNSCSLPLAPNLQCSGRGYCKAWNTTSTLPYAQKASFCVCSPKYADPECRTTRKSQQTAFFYAFFGGFLGLDHFYLGEIYTGLAKITTLGGLGLWWIIDIVRIGSGPVYAENYRLAADLDHGTFIIFTVVMFSLLGWKLFGTLASVERAANKKAALYAKAEAMFDLSHSGTVDLPPPEPEDEFAAKKINYVNLIPYYGATWRQDQAKIATPYSDQLPLFNQVLAHGGPDRNYVHYHKQDPFGTVGGGQHQRPRYTDAAKEWRMQGVVDAASKPSLTPWLPPWEIPTRAPPAWQRYSTYIPPEYENQEAELLAARRAEEERKRAELEKMLEEAAVQDAFDDMENAEMSNPKDGQYTWISLPGQGTAPQTTLMVGAKTGAFELQASPNDEFKVGDSISIGQPGGSNELNVLSDVVAFQAEPEAPLEAKFKLQAPLSNSYPAGAVVTKAFSEGDGLALEESGKLYNSTALWQAQSGTYTLQTDYSRSLDLPANELHARNAFLPYTVGQSVYVEGDGAPVHGIIERANANRTYLVKYEDGQWEEDVPLMNLQPRPDHAATLPGQRVVVRKANGVEYKARVQQQNADGTCKVVYDGNATENVSPSDMMVDQAHAENPAFSAGQTIDVQSEQRGGLYSGMMEGPTGRGTHQVQTRIRGGKLISVEAHLPYVPGQMVYAERNGRYYAARVVQQNANGTIQIRYDIDSEQESVRANSLQDTLPYHMGQKVMVDRASESLFAEVQLVHDNGTFRVVYDADGSHEDVPVHRMTAVVADAKGSAASKRFEVGDTVKVLYRTDMWKAKIKAKNDNGSYTIQYDADGSVEDVTVDRILHPDANADYSSGQHVQVERQGKWHDAIVAKKNVDGTYNITYDNVDNDQYRCDDVPVTKMRDKQITPG